MSKSTLRHILTALGAVLVFIGLGTWTGLIDILLANLDAVWAAGSTLVGVVIAIWGYFKGRETAGKTANVLGLSIDKSLIRHILTALGVVLTFIGLGRFTGLTDLLLANLDAVWAAASTIIGAIVAIYGFFKGKPAQPA